MSSFPDKKHNINTFINYIFYTVFNTQPANQFVEGQP